MRDWNIGITRTCCVCGKSYWCDDGDYICSGSCYAKYEKFHLNEEKDEWRSTVVDIFLQYEDQIERTSYLHQEMEYAIEHGEYLDEDICKEIIKKIEKESVTWILPF